VSCVRRGRWKVGDDDLIERVSGAAVGRDLGKRGMSRFEWSAAVDEVLADRACVNAAQAYDADPAAARWSSNSDDRIAGREHLQSTTARRLAAVGLLPQGDIDRLRKRVSDAFGGHTWHFGDGHVDEAPLVGVQRTELLVETSLFDLLDKEFRHVFQLD